MACRARPTALAISVCSLVAMLLIAGLVPPASAGLPKATDAQSDNVSLVANLRIGNASDMAFWGDLAVINVGLADQDDSNDGFAIVDISRPEDPREVSRFACPHAAYDISIWRHLVILSSETRATVDECKPKHPSLQEHPEVADILVVDISRPETPVLAAAVLTECWSSHTHTLFPDRDEERLIVYNSSSGCVAPVTIPIDDPGAARSHAQFFTGLDGPLGGNDGSAACHDVTVFMDRELAACAAAQTQKTQLWNIADPLQPEVLATIENKVMEHHHSTAFSWDGDTLVLGEEKFSSLVAEQCTAGTGSPLGALWFYDVSDPRNPTYLSYYQLPRAGIDGFCTAHYFSVVPLRSGRDILTSAWYRGGTTVVDFTDPKNPKEIAYFEASPNDASEGSRAYSSYWYNGFVYVTNFAGSLFSSEVFGSKRGLDVLRIDDPVFKDAAHRPYLNVATQMWNVPGGPPPDAGRLGAVQRPGLL